MWHSVCILYISSFKTIKGIEVKRESPSEWRWVLWGKKGPTTSGPSIRCLWLRYLQKFASLECQTWFDQKHIATAKYQREKKAESKKYPCLRHLNIVAVKRKKEEWAFFFSFPENKEDKENTEQAWTFLVFWVFFFFFFSTLTATY